MRAFLLVPIAFIAAVSATNLEQRSPLHALRSLTARNSFVNPDGVPDECKSSCSTIASTLDNCDSASCACTNKNGQSLKVCADCLVKVGNISQSQGQTGLDYFVLACMNSGVNISSLSVGGSVSGSSNSALHIVANGGVLVAAFAGALACLL